MQNDDQNIDEDNMRTLSSCLNKAVLDGYSDDFKITNDGLKSLTTGNMYQPGDIIVKNFFRFEGPSDPDENTIMYVIETNDGLKGTLVDAYGTYADTRQSEFMTQVEDFQKKIPKAGV